MAMMNGGKTAPCLAADIRTYSPHLEYLAKSQTQNAPSAWNTQVSETYNPLRDPPPGYEQPERIRVRPRGGCRHFFTTKQAQSIVPAPDDVPESGTCWKSASICQNCCWHFDVTVSFEALESDREEYCGPPSTAHPLHHFVHGVRLGIKSNDDGVETYWYRCTNCPTSVHVALHPPRLSDGEISLLTDQQHLDERFRYARDYDETRPGLAPQRAFNVLEALAKYIKDAVSGDPSKINRPIPKFNKRFMLSFGDDCDELLTRLGFTFACTDDNDNQEVWYLPHPPDADPLDSTSEKAYLLDVREELLSLIRRYPEIEMQNLRWVSSSELAVSADESLDRVLGASTYDKAFSKRSQFETSDDPLYAGLGALPDFSDALVLYAFDRQMAFDQQQSPYYYDCLSLIAEKRNSESINIEIATMASQGFISRKDVEKAYNYFTIDPQQAPHMEDRHILGLFQSRLESAPAYQEAEIRRQLHIIGRARGSNMLTDAASNIVQNYEQALRWLDHSCDGSMGLSDDIVLAHAAAKIAENPSDENMCRKVVEIIAKHRNSDYLYSWLANGSAPADAPDDELTAAYKFFDIKDRSAALDADVLETQLAVKVGDEPGREEEARRHYEVLLHHIKGGGSLSKPDYNNPVGLANMGNTCYLNSLLQYFFTVKPLRDIILDFHLHKMDVSVESFEPKRVGGRKIMRFEAEKTQEFVIELRVLFQQMAHSAGPVVNPTWRLAGLALAEDGTIHRRSTVSQERPGNLLKRDSQVGMESPKESIKEQDVDSPGTIETVTVLPDNVSEETLVDDVIVTPESDEVIKEVGSEQMMFENMRATPAPDPSKQEAPEQPNRPPPIPPRPKPHPDQLKNDTWREKAEAAALQQDVAEVIDNVLFKTECAIRPDSIDSDGEQIDRIKDLFYGKYLWSYSDKKLQDKEEPFSTLYLSLTSKPQDVYAALDDFFDEDMIMHNRREIDRFGTITHLPPILQLYFHRQEFDKEKNESRVIKHHINLNETLFLDRYLQSSDPSLLEKRKEFWALKKELSKLRESRDARKITELEVDDADALDATWQLINSIGEDIDVDQAELEDTLKLTKEFAADLRSSLNSLDKKIMQQEKLIGATFADLTSAPYVISAVFVHRGRGGSKGGHYWIYIRDFGTDIWRRYEDREVTEVKDPQSEIFGEKDPEITGAPYFVVYVRDEMKDVLVDALYRSPPEPTSPRDVEMIELDGFGVEEDAVKLDESMRETDSRFVEPGEDPTVTYHG